MNSLQNSSAVLMFHAELEVERSKASDHPTHYSTFLNSRPEQMEYDAIEKIIELQRSYPSLHCHIVHLSASSALPLIRKAKKEGLNLTVETTFHYLCLSADEIPDGKPQFKCCPPIRDKRNRDLLWKAVIDGTIDMVVSDHSPCVASLKRLDDGNVMEAWGGISSLGFGLYLLWEEGLQRGLSVGRIVQLLSENPARLAGLQGHVGPKKGQIAEGYNADFVIWDPNSDVPQKVCSSILLILPQTNGIFFHKIDRFRNDKIQEQGHAVRGENA